MSQNQNFNSLNNDYVLLSFLGLLIYVIIINAWVTDDAFITFRVLDNLVNGYGLKWNVTERVQAFTNPLWLFVHVPFYLITKEVFLTTIFISLLFNIATFWISIRLFNTSSSFVFAFLLIPLMLSKAFTEYATSGLENPLTFFFLVLFYLIILNKNKFSSFLFTLYCFLVAGLAGFNRLDTLIFYLPVLAYLLINKFNLKTFIAASLGILPLMLWELFSVFYYGFLLPNTAYAKLSTGIVTSEYMQQGIVYFIDLIKLDPISAITIIIAILFVIQSFYQSLINRKLPNLEQLLGLGFLLYCAYIIKIGGDFMSGRFWSAPFFIAVLLLNGFLHNYDQIFEWKSYIIGCVLAGIFIAIFPSSKSEQTVGASGIADERKFYLQTNGLVNFQRHTPANHHWSKHGTELNLQSKNLKSPLIAIMSESIGMRGFYAGHNVVLIDEYALSDPLLARLPVIDNENWRIGHFTRHIPYGYVELHQIGSMTKMSPILAEYYRPLHYIISGPLFDWDRIRTIWKFNNGEYDYYLHKYLIEEKNVYDKNL